MLTLITSAQCPSCVQLKTALRKREIAYREVDSERVPVETWEKIDKIMGGNISLPIIIRDKRIISMREALRPESDCPDCHRQPMNVAAV